MDRIETILLTTDFSETSARAVEPAVLLAKQFRARILVAFVEEDRLPPMVIEYMAVGLQDLLEKQRVRGEERVREFVKQHLEGLGLEIETVVVLGTPHIEIVHLAQQRDVDLIVMATHGRGFITHAIMGSTTERVLRRSTCPVLVVREAKVA